MVSPTEPTDPGGGRPSSGSARSAGLWERAERMLLLNVATGFALLATAIMLIEALSRSVLSSSYFWAEESVRYLMLWAYFMTIGCAGRAGRMIRTELLIERLPDGLRRALNVTTTALGLLFAGILLYASVPQVLRYRSIGMMTESNLDLPMWVLFLAMPLGAIVMGLYYVGALRDALRGDDPYRLADPETALPGETK